MRNYIMIIYVLTWYKFPIYAMGKMEWNRYEITWILGTMCILIYNIKSLYTYKYIQNYYILWSGRAPNIKGGYCKVDLLSQTQYNTCITKSNISLSHCAIYEMYLQIMLILAFLYKKEACKICQLTTDWHSTEFYKKFNVFACTYVQSNQFWVTLVWCP